MDLRSLQTFMEVAELKSFTRAAHKLGYSQPTVSFQIRQLEQEIGMPVFDRIGHTVSLTDAGREALHYAQQICNLSREMTEINLKDRPVSGLIRIGMADSLCDPLIARNFELFRQEYSGISMQIFTAGTGELFRMLDHNEVDMICTMDSRVYDTSYITVGEEPVGVNFVISPGNPLANLEDVTLERLLEEPFLLTEKGMSYRRVMDEMLAARSLEVLPVLEAAQANLICDLVTGNQGVSFLPDYVTENAVRKGQLVRLNVRDFQVTVWKQLLYRRDKWISPQMRAMLAWMSQIRLQENPE